MAIFSGLRLTAKNLPPDPDFSNNPEGIIIKENEGKIWYIGNE